MGKDRLLRCLINTGKRLRKAGEIVFYGTDVENLNKKENEIMAEFFTKFQDDLYNLRKYIDEVLLFLSIEKQTAVGKPINKKFLGQVKKEGE